MMVYWDCSIVWVFVPDDEEMLWQGPVSGSEVVWRMAAFGSETDGEDTSA
jgi:hypothetical protein